MSNPAYLLIQFSINFPKYPCITDTIPLSEMRFRNIFPYSVSWWSHLPFWCHTEDTLANSRAWRFGCFFSSEFYSFGSHLEAYGPGYFFIWYEGRLLFHSVNVIMQWSQHCLLEKLSIVHWMVTRSLHENQLFVNTWVHFCSFNCILLMHTSFWSSTSLSRMPLLCSKFWKQEMWILQFCDSLKNDQICSSMC